MKIGYQARLVKFFGKENCPNCVPMKEIVKDLQKNGIIVQQFDVDSVDGRAEAMFYDVMGTPSLVLVDQKGNELTSWRSKVPDAQEVLKNFEE
jgi:thioredoxin-related protein